jgi:hypothetical protein
MSDTEMSSSNDVATEFALANSTPDNTGAASTNEATPAAGAGAEQVADPAAQAAVEAAKAQIAQYTPNLKFKVLDKEHEIDKMFHGIIKDAETEKKIRELHEKAFGLDSVKLDRQSLKQKIDTHYAPLEKEYQGTIKALGMFDKMIEQKDYDNFFATLQIPEQEILKWAVQKAKLMSLPPEEQQAYNQTVQQRNRLYSLEQQAADTQEQNFSMQVQARAAQLDQELSKPEVLSVAEAYDAKAGKPGAFKAEVINRGKFYAFQGKDISVEEAVKEVAGMFAPFITTAAAPVTPQNEQQQAQVNSAGNGAGTAPQAQAPAQKPPVIPNVAGQGTSPAKKVVRSLDDIRALSKQMNG